MEETGGAVRAADKEVVLVYGHLHPLPLVYPKNTLSILLITEHGEVYGGGMNYKEGKSKDSNIYTKVWNLDRNVKKIAVGPEYGAAIDRAGRLMVWKHTNLYPGLETYKFVTCFQQVNLLEDPVDCIDFGEKPEKLIKYNEGTYTLLCHECFMPGTCKFMDTDNSLENTSIRVFYCSSCKRCFNPSNDIQIMNMLNAEHNPVETILRANYVRMKDFAFFGDSICLLFENNKLYIRNPVTYVEEKIKYQMDENCTSDKVVAVYGEGAVNGRLFIKYEDGSFFKCSRFTSEHRTTEQQNSFYRIPSASSESNHVLGGSNRNRSPIDKIDHKLSVIKLRAAVDKVCCGLDHTAVLLNDGSVWFIASDCTTSRLVHNSGANVFTDIALIGSTNIFLVQASAGKTRDRSSMNIRLSSSEVIAIVEFYESTLNDVLREMVHPKSLIVESCAISARTLPIQNIPLPTANIAQLYGKSYLADMTIKLADEELPAHSSVLFGTSTHFQSTFNAENPPPKVLDVSQYNPKAYKYLLQYFYQIQPDDLNVEDFAHLREIATSYGETPLADAATAKIKSQLCEDNVENIFTLSKRFGFPDVAIECEKIMCSQSFMEKLLRKTMKNLAL